MVSEKILLTYISKKLFVFGHMTHKLDTLQMLKQQDYSMEFWKSLFVLKIPLVTQITDI